LSTYEKNYFAKILECLENETGEIIMDEETIRKARIPVERMTAIGR
jgi:quinolinate synthase